MTRNQNAKIVHCTYWVLVDEERQYFHLTEERQANTAAQNEANRTGKPVAVEDLRGFKHLPFSPKGAK